MTDRVIHPDGLPRCSWPKLDPLYVRYHDEEWGVPEYDDRALYEKFVLDGFQADGLGQEGAICGRTAHDHWMNSPSSGQHTATIRL
jgi:Methyladenine glycosylase